MGTQSNKTFLHVSLIYSILAAVLVYKNLNSLSMLFFAILTVIFYLYIMKKEDISIKKDSYIIMAFMVMISVSSFFTNYYLIGYLNIIIISIVFIILTVHNYVDDRDFDVLDYIKALMVTIFNPLISYIDGFLEGDLIKRKKANKAECNTAECNTEGDLKEVLIGILASTLLLSVIIPLLTSSDILFNKVLVDIIKHIDAPSVMGFVLMIVIIFFVSFVMVGYVRVNKEKKYKYGKGKNCNKISAMIILISISTMYLAFSYIQIAGLFFNKLTLPEGSTYAEYAREGFFQLLFVAFINLLLVIWVLHSVFKNRVISILLIIVSISTYIMIVSSFYRMYLYVKSYGLSHLRYFVFFGLVFIFFVLTGAVINILLNSFNYSKYIFFMFMIVYIVFSYSRPCYVISKYNWENINYKELDYSYISNYSTDAAPIMLEMYKSKMIKNEKDLSFIENFFSDNKAKDIINPLYINLSKNTFKECYSKYYNEKSNNVGN